MLTRIGSGGSSSVWLAEERARGVRVALKVARGSGMAAVVAEEGLRLAFADSPALARVLDAGVLEAVVSESGETVPGGAYIALEWVPGRALDPTSIEEEVRLGLSLRVARDVAEALDDLHRLGAAHGDVKPQNILILGDRGAERARVVDLGLGAHLEEARPRGGTVRYLAPELNSPGQPGDARARDLWALGIVLAEVAVGDVARAPDPLARVSDGSLPAPVAELVLPLLSARPGARPSADWVRRRAMLALGVPECRAARAERGRRRVERTYVALRRAEIIDCGRARSTSIELGGAPAEWLRAALEIAHRIHEARGLVRTGSATVRELDAALRARWLVHVVGAPAAGWPPPGPGDEVLAARLLSAVERADVRGLRMHELEGETMTEPPGVSTELEVALRLGEPHPRTEVLDAAERLVLAGAPLPIGLALGRALRRAGELGHALAVFGRLNAPEALVEAAETARRARDEEACRRLLGQIAGDREGPDVRARRAAILSRLALDHGDAEEARRVLEGVGETAPALEARALVEVAAGQRTAALRTLERARSLASDEEQIARLEAVTGNVHHSAGDFEAALSAFRRAAEHATRVGAVLEEATYLTGVAACAVLVGELGETEDAARRAELLFEHLGRPRDAARAALSRAAVFASLGATVEAEEAARAAIARARAEGDRQCQAYAHLAIADALPIGDRDALEHALRASLLLGDDAGVDDRLRVSARVLARGGEVDIAALDREARGPSVALDARLEWWGARAAHAVTSGARGDGELILSELGGVASVLAPAGLRGPALASGAALAAQLGAADTARRLAQAAKETARDLLRRASPELRTRLSSVRCIASLDSPPEPNIAPEQVADLENLVRMLGRRDRLRPLLDQVLDALLLWTGVERGLLLLRAPGGKLVSRAARNIARADLDGAQLELSHSLAERALAQGQPVVAVDASGELPEVHASVHALKLRSVLAVPLISRGEALGVVYLDDRVRRGAFGARELSWVKLVASLASVAIADARDQLLLRRAARRARRAEAKLERQLARREAELELAERELARARSSRETRFSYAAIVGQSESIRSMLSVLDRVAGSEVPVLVLGESGSGKELVARAIHENGPRRGRPFVSENCGAIPEPLLESTLFGHVRGAFTGANRPRAGLFEIASTGTLFLDEIAEMSLGMQTKLLRVLEQGELRPVGSERSRHVDVRIIGATHRDLEAMVAEGRFRQDLYYRLNVITVRVPALRERTGDVELLVRHFLRKHAGARPVDVSREAMSMLAQYDWPGNVRQLENEIRRALVMADEEIGAGQLSSEITRRGSGGPGGSRYNVRERVDALEGELVREVLEQTAGNQTRAAELLGLSRFGLQKMMKRLGIDASTPRKRSVRCSEPSA